jgi:3'-5' exoribonuclease
MIRRAFAHHQHFETSCTRLVRVESEVHGQVDACPKETRDGKPFYELVIADAENRLTLRAWSGPRLSALRNPRRGAFLAVSGEFSQSNNHGLDAKRWSARHLNENECALLLEGPPALRTAQASDFAFIETTIAALADPRLRALTQMFLADFGDRFRRAAAARGNHHARRGGLVEHTAQ